MPHRRSLPPPSRPRFWRAARQPSSAPVRITDTAGTEQWALKLIQRFYDYIYEWYGGTLDIASLNAAAALLDPSATTANAAALQQCLGRKIEQVRAQASSPKATTSRELRAAEQRRGLAGTLGGQRADHR